MDCFEYLDNYESYSKKKMTRIFNSFSEEEREVILESLPNDKAHERFINGIRKQAVNDFWTHERELIKDGKCTRDWTPEQIEEILNLKKNGTIKANGGRAHDIDGETYYGHHMMNVENHEKYAGDWRNIQALNHDEHYHGAHNGNTRNKTESYYNPDTKKNIPIHFDNSSNSDDVATGKGYIPTKKCVFLSDEAIKDKYSQVEKINDAELLALKYYEYAKGPKGTIADYNRAIKIAEKYKCKDFKSRFGINNIDLSENKMNGNSLSSISTYEIDHNVIEQLGLKKETDYVSDLSYNIEGKDKIDKNIGMSDRYDYFIGAQAEKKLDKKIKECGKQEKAIKRGRGISL